MEIKDFKLVKNRQRPKFCYAYRMYNNNGKYQMFTMDGGKTFIASIESKTLAGNYTTDFNKTFNSIDECISAFKKN